MSRPANQTIFDRRRLASASALALALGLAVTGCASESNGDDDDDFEPTEGDAYLTIVGEGNVFLENDWQQEITVRYHDGDDRPLAGQIEFAVLGNSGGSTLSAATAITDAAGEATILVVAGASGEAAFTVQAAAAYAAPVDWQIAVRERPEDQPLDPVGRYSVRSDFDLVSGLPGTVGTVVNGFIDMTDGPYDPATWIIDRVLEGLDNSTIENLVSNARPVLDGIVNDLLLSLTPDFVDTILEIGDKFGQVAQEFGTVSILEVTAGDGIEGNGFGASHTLTHFTFTVDGQAYTFSMADLGMENLVAADVGFAMPQETDVTIGAHSFPLSYGSILLVALNEIIIPAIDGGADGLGELLLGMVDCASLAAEVADYIGLGSDGLYEGACEIGINAAAGALIDQIASLDQAGMILGIDGDARPMDTNADDKVDVLMGGAWGGTVTYVDTPAPLGESTFRGDRMNLP
jgi:hypothetical protein